ncbi:MAG: cytochrome c [Pseudomonadales bacterium]|nr:cytochrome c [Pseudomonadales bacterium]
MFNRRSIISTAAFGAAVLSTSLLTPAQAQVEEVTFHKDIVPILQRSCQNCHREGGGGPMPLVTYNEVTPFAGLIEYKTGIRDRAGAMPPWYMEKNIGIQDYKDDISLSDEEIAKISYWARNGTPEGDPADAPAPLVFDDSIKWRLGEPDLILKSEEITKLAGTPDWWGEIPYIPTGLTEDRYVKSLEVIEVNDVDPAVASRTVGGRYIVHHMLWGTGSLDENGNLQRALALPWPIHEVGRNGDIFDEDGARLLKAGSVIYSDSVHLHAAATDATAHLEFGFTFQPKDYEPRYQNSFIPVGNGVDISIVPNKDKQELHAYEILRQHTKIISFEPHLHAPGERMCLEAIWGSQVETLACVGYDHNWVRTYQFEDHAAPLLPEGTILHVTGYANNTESNTNIPDPRNWQGSGNSSIQNMFIDLGLKLALTEDQFFEAMEERREVLNLGPNDHVIGCPLCTVPLVAPVEGDD